MSFGDKDQLCLCKNDIYSRSAVMRVNECVWCVMVTDAADDRVSSRSSTSSVSSAYGSTFMPHTEKKKAFVKHN